MLSCLSKLVKIRICRITVLPFFNFIYLFYCSICSVKLRKDYRLKMSNKTVLRRICEPKRKKMTRLEKIGYCRDRVSSCNIYAVQQDTQSVLMSEFIHHVC